MRKVMIASQQGQFVAYAKLRKQSVDGADLNAGSAAGVSNSRSANVIISVRLYERETGKTLNDLRLCLRPGEALKQFLQDQAGSDNHRISQQEILQDLNFRLTRFGVSPQRQRPDTGIDEDRHARRDRSAL